MLLPETPQSSYSTTARSARKLFHHDFSEVNENQEPVVVFENLPNYDIRAQMILDLLLVQKILGDEVTLPEKYACWSSEEQEQQAQHALAYLRDIHSFPFAADHPNTPLPRAQRFHLVLLYDAICSARVDKDTLELLKFILAIMESKLYVPSESVEKYFEVLLALKTQVYVQSHYHDEQFDYSQVNADFRSLPELERERVPCDDEVIVRFDQDLKSRLTEMIETTSGSQTLNERYNLKDTLDAVEFFVASVARDLNTQYPHEVVTKYTSMDEPVIDWQLYHLTDEYLRQPSSSASSTPGTGLKRARESESPEQIVASSSRSVKRDTQNPLTPSASRRKVASRVASSVEAGFLPETRAALLRGVVEKRVAQGNDNAEIDEQSGTALVAEAEEAQEGPQNGTAPAAQEEIAQTDMRNGSKRSVQTDEQHDTGSTAETQQSQTDTQNSIAPAAEAQESQTDTSNGTTPSAEAGETQVATTPRPHSQTWDLPKGIDQSVIRSKTVRVSPQ